MTHERTPQTASTPSEGTSQGGCIVAALRILARDIYCEDGVATQCIREAADEIERLREAIRRLAEQDATLSVCDGNVTVTMDGTLTDAEREAIQWASQTLCVGWADLKPQDRDRSRKAAATLESLLERIG